MNVSKPSKSKRPTIPPGLSALVEENVDSQLENAPQNVEAAIIGARFVTLRWKPPAHSVGEISSYSVFYREEGSYR